MKERSPWFQRFALGAVGAAFMCFLVVLFEPTITYALGSNKLPNPAIVSPCPPLSSCKTYEEIEKVQQTVGDTITLAVVLAALNAFTYMTQQLANYTANFVLSGGKGGGPGYEKKTFGQFLTDTAADATNNFMVDMNNYAKVATGFDLCTPFGLQAFDLQLSMGSKIWQIKKKQGCGFKQISDNFSTSYQSLTHNDILKSVKANFQPDKSDIGIAIKFHQKLLVTENAKLKGAEADRREYGGFKPIVDAISGNIRTPAQTFSQTLAETNAVKQRNRSNSQTFGALTANAFQIGLYQLPIVFGATFLNTMANAGLASLKQLLTPKPDGDDIKFAQLNNPFAQAGAEKKRVSAFTDIVTPNLFTSDQQDFVHELSSCPTPRGLWGCSMDDTFALGLRAADESGAFTVARALGIGTEGKGLIFLRADWQLIPESDVKENRDPGCAQRAYCGANLAKLRFARILPIGWELAANSPYNKKLNGRYVTLGDVVQNFNSCNEKGGIDAAHPWCHLIDPSWVLTAPPFQCRVRGYGDTVIGASIPIRVQECSDVVSCVERNDKGECIGGYGYCLSDKTVWRFSADACQEKFVSCRTYQKRNPTQSQSGVIPADTSGGPQVSFLRNTIDYGSCSSDNVGCMYYETTHDVSSAAMDRWVGALSLTPSPKIVGPRVYFDATVESCPASADGCTKVLKMTEDQPALNLVKNGSFEMMDSKDEKKFDAWERISPSPSAYPSRGSISLFGAQSAEFQAPGAMRQAVTLAPFRNYIFSAYLRRSSDPSPSIQLKLQLQKSDGTPVDPGTFYRSKNCSSLSSSSAVVMESSGLDENWKRFTCEFVTNRDAVKGYVLVFASGKGGMMDGVELEEGTRATNFVDGANPSLEVDYLKIAPEEFACVGDVKKDRKECANFARVCAQTDTGCQGYTDADRGDGTEIPATVSKNDLCPLSCVGYAEYQKLPSAFDLTRNVNPLLDDKDDDTSAFFIPSSGQACTAAGVGCEQFTNLEAAAAGGEKTSLWTYVRACSKPNADSTTYFTWEGSETTGYQLRTWSFIKDKSVFPSPPLIRIKAGPDGVAKDPKSCTVDTWKSGADPDCRQLYDEKGNAFYRYFSQTILSSPDCKNYRLNDSDFADCTLTGGSFNTATNECVYAVLASQSVSCPASEISCRAYLGSTGRASAIVASEKFSKAGSVGNFASGAPGSDIATSPEALTVGDNSLKVSTKAPGASSSITYAFPAVTGTSYTLVFWSKTTAVSRAAVTISIDGKVAGSFTPLVDWSRFEIGPFTATKTPTSTISWSGVPNATYIDELSIRRLQDIVYVKKRSWVTPPECDETTEKIPEPQAMLGCRRYKDRGARMVSLRAFSHLCRYENIGCSAYVDTRNSMDAYAQSYVLPGLAKVSKSWDTLYADTVTSTRPADRYVYLIDEPRAHCDAANASCRAFGKPKFTADRSLAPTTDTSNSFETVYLKDDISKYVDAGGEPNMLCRPSELFCDRFTSGPITSYFRDPGDHVCEWRDKATVPAGTTYPAGPYSGWFVKGSAAAPCYPEKLSSGNTFLSEFTGAPGYRGWTDTCPAEQSECTEFRDPNDHSDLSHPAGRPYFFINNNKLDKTTCGGRVDLLSGCVLFRDMNESRLLSSTIATYAKSAKENNDAQSPINCQTDTDNPFCKDAGRCTNVQFKFCTFIIKDSFGKDAVINGRLFTKGGKENCLAQTPLTGVMYHESNVSFANKQQSFCTTDADCTDAGNAVFGTCSQNDSNLIVKVKLDRDCQQWLGCSSGETVYDASQGKYVDLCTNVAVCDKAIGSQGKNFCAHYASRPFEAVPKPLPRDSLYETVLREGNFINASAYIARQIGLGKPDYSGYTLPNHFQVADFQSRRVAYELLANAPGSARDRYVNDYRIVAAALLLGDFTLGTSGAPIWASFPSEGGLTLLAKTQKTERAATFPSYFAQRYLDPKFPRLNLCQHAQTGQIGYFVGSADHIPNNPLQCYFAIDTPYTQNSADLALGGGGVNARNAQDLSVLFEQLDDPMSRQPLSQAFPPAECKAYPDGSSPFPTSYVTEWDLTSDPPKPKSFAPGYDNAPVCEFGEDCACSYRKVSYGGTTKYFSPFGSPAPIGVCVGGGRAGQTCVPDAVIPAKSATTTLPGEAGVEVACGPSGICEAIQSVSYIRGQFGQCLQRDAARTVAGSQDKNPCLVWNPTPLLFGQNDIYHYQPTAGYLPPQNSGEYYCVSSAVPPSQVTVTPNCDWIKEPGSMECHKFHYYDAAVSDGESCVSAFNAFLPSGAKCTGSDALFIDGVKANGGAMGSRCEDADDDQDNGGNSADGSAGRWIQTGRGKGRNYAEYFVELNRSAEVKHPSGWAKWLMKTQTPTVDQIKDAFLERNFSFFEFSNIRNPNGRGRIGCGYSQEWVPGVEVGDYDKLEDTQPAGRKWEEGFNKEFKKLLIPSSQDFLRTPDGEKLLKVPCFWEGSSGKGGDGKCFYKYWELGYQGDGQEKFQFQGKGGKVSRFGAKDTLMFLESKASRPFFAIRAMFEDTNADENKITAGAIGPSGNTLGGPFRFVGFWITASVPGVDSEQAIYMYLKIGHADICREVAQVVAPDTRETTPFTDRVWEHGGFTIPKLGIAWNSTNPPFGSALATRPIGRTPLFQVRGRLPGTQSKLTPPAFIASGLEYFRGDAPPNGPNGNWAWLTNVFARVYRIYRYYDRPVTKDSWACVVGPNFGAWCPAFASPDVSKTYCGYSGACVSTLSSAGAGSGICNALSGVNSGLSCSGDTSNEISGYHACHNAPLQANPETGTLRPLYTSCEIQSAPTKAVWEKVPGGYSCTSGPSCGWQTKDLTVFTFPIKWENEITPSDPRDCDPFTKICSPHALALAGTTPVTTVYTPRVFTDDEINAGKWSYLNQGEFGDIPLPLAVPFRCAKNAISVPDDKGLPIPLVPVKCTAPAEESKECPMQVLADTLANHTTYGESYTYSKCVGKGSDGYGHCSNGFEHAQCNQDAHCRFTWFEWWGIDKDGSSPSKPLTDIWPSPVRKIYVGGNEPYGKDKPTTLFPQSGWWTNNPLSGVKTHLGVGDQNSKGGIGDIGGNDLKGGRSAQIRSSDPARALLDRFPGAYVAGYYFDESSENFFAEYIPGHCERAPVKNPEDDKKTVVGGSPYAPDRLVGGGPKRPSTSGVCDRGLNAGRACTSNDQCRPKDLDLTLENDSKSYCKAVTDLAGNPAKGTAGTQTYDCKGSGDASSDDPALDNNRCTNAAGYQPRSDVCGNDPKRRQCLTAITQSDSKSFDPKQSQSPTDVTNGLYTPVYLDSKSGDTKKFSGSYDYIAYYTPRPPMIAAPDTSRQCPSAGTCPIARLNAFTLENQTEGSVSYSGGQAIATIRFYGWAADNQAPLKDLWVDWGDGAVQELHDARMKNKKPFCGGSKECQNVPGLACGADDDCPPGGGKCRQIGSCRGRPFVSCFADSDCAGGVTKDTCAFRTTFGNSDLACEKNYFEFIHAYACGSEKRGLPTCVAGRCARNNAVACTTDSACGPLDTCLTTLAPPGGCFDAGKASCRFTPRVLLKDNWGWCTGECRVNVVDGKLTGGFKGSGVENNVLFNNGGCYDGSKDYQNQDSKIPYSVTKGSSVPLTYPSNLCDPASYDRLFSPWVVYRGALNLGITK